jgi:hypothetical protein
VSPHLAKYLIFKETTKLFFSVTGPFYIPASKVLVNQLLFAIASSDSSWWFSWHYFKTNDVEDMLICHL